MSNALKLAAAVGGAFAPLYVDDVFSTYLYTGNSGTQTITNGIDLAGKGGMVWIKSRSAAFNNILTDTVRGANNYLSTDRNLAQGSWSTGITSFNSDGFSLGNNSLMNPASEALVSWAFRKAPKFFDVVTYIGDGVAGRQISHSLGVAPGMMIIKCTSQAGAWPTQHRSVAMPAYGYLNLTGQFAPQGANAFNGTAANASAFTVGSNPEVNQSGEAYVAYLFAHDPSADGIVQCGSFTTDGSGNATVNLGWEPQYVLFKNSQNIGTWQICDTSRGMSNTKEFTLSANSNNAELSWGQIGIVPTATGFNVGPSFAGNSNTHVYLAIRRSNKPPTSGTEVFQPVTYTGNGEANRLVNTGLLTDLVFARRRNSSSASYAGMVVCSRLTGNGWMKTGLTQAELTTNGLETPTVGYGNSFSSVTGFGISNASDGANLAFANLNGSNLPYIAHAFKRAKGFMDVVCYTGTVENGVYFHSLGAVPELIIEKARSTGSGDNIAWQVHHPASSSYGLFNSPAPFSTGIPEYAPTLTTFRDINALAGQTRVAILFATLPGISKVGSVSVSFGGSTQVDCGFTTGARLVLIKSMSVGDWMIFDTARGITVANDPFLTLNSSVAEVGSNDVIEPHTTGFTLKAAFGAGTYLYLAIA